MKIRSSSIPTVDWSEFHVWSPSGVYKRIKTDQVQSQKKTTVTLSVSSVNSSLAASTSATKIKGLQVAKASGSALPSFPIKSRHVNKKELEQINLHKHGILREAEVQFAAGAIGGSTATYTTHWLDTIKVKMQTQPGLYRGGATCLVDTVRSDGITGLYQGAVPAVIGQAAKTAVVFMSYGLCEEAVRRMTGCDRVEEMTVWHHAGSGAMTGIVASFVLCPLELLKCRLQALNQVTVHIKSTQKQKLFRTMTSLTMARHILKTEGFPGLYRGLPGIWVKEVPGSFIYFGSYEFAKYAMRRFSEKEHLNRRSVFICGMYAGLCYCITHPIESVKTRVQVMSAVTDTKGFLRTFCQILKTEGIVPLCSGMGPSMIRACLYSGIQFVTYETVKEAFLNDH